MLRPPTSVLLGQARLRASVSASAALGRPLFSGSPVAEQSDNGDTHDVSPKQAAELIAERSAQLIDVREPHEWDAGRIPGARHIALGLIPAEAESIDRDRPVVFQCRSGSRSKMVTTAFRASGYDAYNLVGGLLEWVADGHSIEPEDGSVADSLPDAS